MLTQAKNTVTAFAERTTKVNRRVHGVQKTSQRTNVSMTVLRMTAISQAAPSLPIIILSARTEVMDKVLLLELGAHDYVTKPFSPRELLARVRTAMRRSTSTRIPLTETFMFSDVKVDFTKMELWRDGKLLQLTSQEFKVLKFMIQNPERVLSREELLNHVWGYRNYPSTRTVDNHILRLRQKLEKDPANPQHFRTVHSSGYKFVP